MQNSNNGTGIASVNTGSYRRIKRLTFILFVVTFALLAAFFLLPSNISREEALEIAIDYVGGGRANRPSRDFEAFRRVWSIEVFYGNLVHEVYVNSRTGDVVRVEIDRWD